MLKSPLPSRARRVQGLSAVAALSLIAAAGAWAAQPGAAPKIAVSNVVSPQAVLADPAAPADVKLFAKAAIEGPAPKPIITRTPPNKVARPQVATGQIEVAQLAAGEVEDAQVAVVADPVWLDKPNGADIARVMPEAIMRQPNLQGRVTMTCLVLANGRLSGCSVLTADYMADSFEVRKGDPPGFGLNKAALELGELFRMAPETRSGLPTKGKRVVIPIRFATTPAPTPAT